MAIKLVDELKAMGNFPIAHAEGINLVKTDGTEDNLQNLFDNGELGGGDDSVTLTQQEYEALTEEEKLNGLYYTYDTKRIYKNGVQYGASEPISLTMEEYKALKEAGAIDEQQEYLIEANTEGILLGAEDIGYNNAESGIQATTVQGAIDKVVENGVDRYSTDEVKTNKVWIDGKPIYRKVLTTEVLASDNVPNTRLLVDFNIDATDISEFIFIKGSIKVKGTNKFVDCSGTYYVGDESQLSAIMAFNGSTILCVLKNGTVGVEWVVNKDIELKAIVEYTKTTDA